MPFTTPIGIEVSVDAADINLQVSVLVEAQARASSSLLVVTRDISVNSCLDAGSIIKSANKFR